MEIEINLIKLLREEIRNIPKPYNDPSISLTVYRYFSESLTNFRTLTGRTKHFVNIMMFGHAIPRKGFKVIDANLRDDYLDRNSEPSELKIFVEEETKGMDQNVRSQDVKFLLEPHLMKTLVNIFSSKYLT